MKPNIVPLSFFSIAGDLYSRLDAEYAQPELLEGELNARKRNGTRVADIVEKYAGSKVNKAFRLDDDTVRYLDIDSVDTQDGLTYPTEIKFKDRPSRATYVLSANDLLVSNVRPERGAITIVAARDAEVIASSGFTWLRLKADCGLSPEYVLAALRSSFVRNQLLRRNRGSMYPAVTYRDVLDLWIPVPDAVLQKSVTDLVRQGIKNHTRFTKLSNALSKRLSKWLTDTIGRPPPSPIDAVLLKDTVSVCQSGELFAAGGPQRFDAEFFRHDYVAYFERLKALPGSFPIGQYYRGGSGRAPGKPVEDIGYLRQAVLTNLGINWSAVSIEPGSVTPTRGRVNDGDILLACTAHEVFYVARKVDYVRQVPKELVSNNVCVADIMILRPRDNKPSSIKGDYVAAFLRSPWGLHQVQRCIRGLRGGHVYDIDVERYVVVPLPDARWMDRYEAASAKAEGLRNVGKQKMNDAVTLVDKWIAGNIAIP